MVCFVFTGRQALVFENAEDGISLVNQHAYYVIVGGELDLLSGNPFAFVESAFSCKHHLNKRALKEPKRNSSEWHWRNAAPVYMYIYVRTGIEWNLSKRN